jgi:hypothetical protein
MHERVQLKIALRELAKLVDTLWLFDKLLAEVTKCTTDLGTQISDLMKRLGLSWAPDLTTSPPTADPAADPEL